jgi:hypothetical protein
LLLFPRRPRALDEAGAESAPFAEPALEARHSSAVGRVVVIVTDQVQKAVQSQDLELLGVGMPRFARLPAGAAGRNREVRWLERQHVGHHVLPPKLLKARMRASLTSAIVMSEGACRGAIRRSQAASPGAATGRPR